ncbi:MAG: GYF domain-containing protein [Planctomycetota bacterium]
MNYPAHNDQRVWWYAVNGQQCGPMSFGELQAEASVGMFNHNDLVLREGMAEWVPAYQVPGLVRTGSMGGAYSGPTGVPGMVIAGFICAFLCAILGLIFCLIGLQESNNRPGQPGKGLAIAGLIISIINLVLGVMITMGRTRTYF